MFKAIIGIISWFPNKEVDRKMRVERFERLLKQLEEYFPNIPLLVIAQNWKEYKPTLPKDSVVVKYEHGLGILGARKELFNEFKKLDYNYIILFDDDAILKTTKDDCDNYLKLMENNPNGFCFLQYEASQLSGCALSKDIVTKENMVNVDAQKREGYEDTIYSNLLHYKYPQVEFTTKGIKCIHFQNANEVAPSTWCNGEYDNDFTRLSFLTYFIVDGFKQNNFDVEDLKHKSLEQWKKDWMKYNEFFQWIQH